jgi:3-methyl-2-oxobutanoate hydroxymethyltransferase
MKLTPQDLLGKKRAGEKIVMLTAYDFPTARIEDECGVDVLLVGDSVGTNMLGYQSVREVTMDDMLHHVAAVSRGAGRAMVLGDMPFRSFDSVELALANARRMVAAGASGVKMEGERAVLPQVRAITAAGIPVCGHIGYTPQTKGEKATLQGRDEERACELLQVACEVEGAGASLMVLELVPEELGRLISRRLAIPTIGIGAGRFCDGQVQVVLDTVGFSVKVYRHARAFGTLGEGYRAAVAAYAAEVRAGAFPAEEHARQMPDEVLAAARRWHEAHPCRPGSRR